MTTIKQVQELVAEHFNLPPGAMRSESRRRSWVRPRQMAMALAHELTGRSSVMIGQQFDRDHTTVLYAIERVGRLCADDAAFRGEMTALRASLTAEA